MVNFTPYSLLTATALNSEFSKKADLRTTAPQSFIGQVNAPIITAGIGVSTVDLAATGSVHFSTTDQMTIPIGSTLQRPLATSFGMVRANSSTGTYEVVLGNGSWAQISTQAAATVSATAPSNLGGPSFGGSTANAIPVSWTRPGAGTPPYLYTLQFRAAGTSNWINWLTEISDSTTSATVSGLLDSTRYEFQVIAQNTAGLTTSPVTGSSTLGFVSGGPTNLIASNPTSTTISLIWTGVTSNPIAYQVRYAPLGVSTWTTFGPPTSDTYMTISGLQSNQQYLCQVLAKNTSGSYESNTVQFTTSGAATLPPNAPANLSFQAVTINSVAVSWNAPTTGSPPYAYQLQYQVAGAIAWTAFKTPTPNTSLVITGLNSATNYLINVIAINSAGSATSLNGSATTLSAVPANGGVAEYQSTPFLPTVSGPISGAVAVNGALSHMGVALDDPPSAYLVGSMIISATCGSGMITMTDTVGNPIQGSGSNAISNFATTLSGARSALATLTYTAGPLSGTDSIRISVTDQLTLISSITISITVGSGGSTSPSPTPPSPPGPPSSTLRTLTGQPTDALGVVASNAFALTNMVAVTTRFELSQYNNGYSTVRAAVIENQINYIGNGGYLRLIRELCAGNMNASWLAQISQNCGGFRYVLAGDQVNFSLYNSIENDMVNMASTFPNFVQGFEGFDPGFVPGNLVPAIQAQSSLNALAASMGVSSYQLAPQDETVAATIGSFGVTSNVGTSRAYLASCPSGASPPTNDVNGGLFEKLHRASEANSSGVNAISAFGYQGFFDTTPPIAISNWLAETVVAKYILEGIFNAFLLNATYIGIQELQDATQAFGLFRNDGTPKPAAQALRIMFQLLGDPSTQASRFTAGRLNYVIGGSSVSQSGPFVNTGLKQVLFQSGNGTFYLWIWNEQPLNDSATNATINVSNVNVVVEFIENVMQSVSIFDPFNSGSIGGEPQPYVTYTSVSSVPVSLPAWPICLKIQHS